MFEYIKQHPVVVGVIVIGGAFIFYEIALNGGNSSDLSGSQIVQSGPSDSEIQATVNQAQLQANAQQQANSDQFQLGYLAQQQAGDYAVANLNAQTSTVQQTNAITGQVQLANISAGLTQQQISTQAAVTEYSLDNAKDIQASINATSTALAKISSDTTLAYADITNNAAIANNTINAGVTTQLANFSLQSNLAQIDASKSIALGAQQVQIKAQHSSFLGGIIGGALSL